MRWLVAVIALAACGGSPAGANGGDDDDGTAGSADGGTNPAGDVDAGDTTGGGGSADPSAMQPEVLAHDCSYMDEMTADATHLYWACNPGTRIHRMPLAGGPIEELYTGPGGALSLAVDGGFIYIAQTRGDAYDYNDLIVRVPVTGGAPTTLVTPIGVRALAIEDGSIYYSDTPDFPARIMRVPTGGGTSHFLVRARAGSTPYELVVDAGVIYYTDYAGVGSVEIQTKKLKDVENGLIPGSLAVDAAYVYFVACETNEPCTSANVYRVPRSGGAPAVFASGHTTQSKLATIDNVLQWGSYVLPTAGGTEQTLLASQSGFVVAATPQAFYLGESSTGTIYRVAR
jgi:hypothetical protein